MQETSHEFSDSGRRTAVSRQAQRRAGRCLLSLGAPTGTVVLPALAIMLGVQFLVSAATLDLQAVPREPVNRGALLHHDVRVDERAGGGGESLPREAEAPLVKEGPRVRRIDDPPGIGLVEHFPPKHD